MSHRLPQLDGAAPVVGVPHIPPIAGLVGVAKAYHGHRVLDDVNLSVEAGRVHVLAGENGAGKSTLIKILTGIEAPDTGEVQVDGQTVRLSGPAAARAHGMAVVHQEFSLVPAMTVAENLVLGREPRKFGGRVDRHKRRRFAEAALQAVGASIDPAREVGELNTGQRQLVEIARALAQRPRLLVLDEPTAVLSRHETEHLLGLIEELRDGGLAVLYISHRMEEIDRLADMVTVLRDGRVADVMAKSETTTDRIVTSMVGRPIRDLYQHDRAGSHGPVRLRVRGLRSAKVPPATFDARAGEILGIAGIVGAGRSELLRLVAGFDRPQDGEVTVDEQPVNTSRMRHAADAGIVMLPESRKEQGLFLGMSIADNVCLGTPRGSRRLGRTSARNVRTAAHEYTHRMRVRANSLDQAVGELSGGNQQKVLLARCLAREPRVLILDEPTRGVDIGAKADIYALIEELARKNVAIVLISSELPELLGMSDRVLVMHRGSIVCELDGDAMTEENIVRHATGLGARRTAPSEVPS